MVRFCYWCVTNTGEKFNFMSMALLDIGMSIQNDEGEEGIIVDMAVEPDISAAEIKYAMEDWLYV